MWVYSLLDILYDKLLQKDLKEVMTMILISLLILLSAILLQGTFQCFFIFSILEITGSINTFNLIRLFDI